MVSEAETGSSVVSSCWLLFLWFCFSSVGLDVSGHLVFFFPLIFYSLPQTLGHTHNSCSAYTVDNTRT